MASCKHCSAELKVPPSRGTRKAVGTKMFCDNDCRAKFNTAIKMQEMLDGKYVGTHLQFKTGGWQRRLLTEKYGYKCNGEGCTVIDTHCGKPITLEVNHIDGDALNNVISNLEFLCANCHSQTPNFRALNEKSTRTYRKKYYAP